MQDKGYVITIQKGACEIYDLSKGAIVVVQISLSKLFPLKIDYAQPCLIVEVKDTSWL